MWRPSAPLANLQRRAAILSQIREFFSGRGVWEVETPILSRAALSDPHIESLSTHYLGPGAPAGQDYYLHTSPEFPMKRLLAAGSGAIYQITKVFRQGERGRRHNPEFTMLEWYRPGWDHLQLMDEVEALAQLILSGLNLAETERLTYQQAFLRYLAIDPFQASVDELGECAVRCGIDAPLERDEAARDDWLNLLLSHQVEPKLGEGRLTFLCDYPPSQAALAKVREGTPTVAERFELYLSGVELANGFHELADADEQRQRFEEDLRQRQQAGLASHPLDEAFLAALQSGLPDSAGVALGVDRLVMLACGAQSIDEVVTFPLEQA